MKATTKLSSQERRAAIIEAVRRVFAEKGFHGTTTRELAEAAGVSEALLFKHFPNKEALYSAMQFSCCDERDEKLEQLKGLEPSASTLVLVVHWLVSRIVSGCASRDDEQAILTRLMLHSLGEDGEFARLLLGRRLASDWIPKVGECLRAAISAGDAVAGPVRLDLHGWFAHHLAVMIAMHLRPAKPVVDYGMPREKLVEQVVWFILRGMGLKETVIKRHYNPKALAWFGS